MDGLAFADFAFADVDAERVKEEIRVVAKGNNSVTFFLTAARETAANQLI
jgi:hypothetical protein